MKIFKQHWLRRLKTRLGSGNAVAELTRRQTADFDHDAAFMTVKEASEIVAHYRREARFAIRTLRLWQARERRPTRLGQGRGLRLEALTKARQYAEARRAYDELVAFSIAAITQRAAANDHGGRHAR
jgi:hypothetical protein